MRATVDSTALALVVELERVGDQVVALHLERWMAVSRVGVNHSVVLHKKLFLRADRGELAGRVPGDVRNPVLVQQRAIPGPMPALVEKWHQRAAVHGAAPAADTGLNASEIENRRRDVDVADELARVVEPRGTVPVALWESHYEWQAARGLVWEDLALDQSMLAVEQAVVGDVDKHGVVQLARLLDRLEDLRHAAIDADQRLQGTPPFRGEALLVV